MINRILHPFQYRRWRKACTAPFPPMPAAPVAPIAPYRTPMPASTWGADAARVDANTN